MTQQEHTFLLPARPLRRHQCQPQLFWTRSSNLPNGISNHHVYEPSGRRYRGSKRRELNVGQQLTGQRQARWGFCEFFKQFRTKKCPGQGPQEGCYTKLRTFVTSRIHRPQSNGQKTRWSWSTRHVLLAIEGPCYQTIKLHKWFYDVLASGVKESRFLENEKEKLKERWKKELTYNATHF